MAERFVATAGEVERYYEESPVFLRAQEVQKKLSEIACKNIGQAVEIAQDAAAELDEEANEQGVIGERARLTGSSLIVPRLMMTPDDGVSVIDSETLEHSESNPLYTPRQDGRFYGFAGRSVLLRDNNDELAGYRPEIGYSLLLAPTVNTPVFEGHLLAYGPAQDTEVHFMADDKHRAATKALEQLHDLKGDSAQYYLHNIVALLSDENSNELSLRQAARLARELYKSEDGKMTQKQLDAVLELFDAYMMAEYGDLWALSAKNALSPVVEDKRYLYAPVEGVASIRTLAWIPYYYTSDNQLRIDHSQCTIGMAVDGKMLKGVDHDVLYVPLEKIETS